MSMDRNLYPDRGLTNSIERLNKIKKAVPVFEAEGLYWHPLSVEFGFNTMDERLHLTVEFVGLFNRKPVDE